MTELRTDICVAEHKHDPDRQRRALDGLYLCGGCRDSLEQFVAEMPARYADLGRALAGGSGGGDQRVSGSAGEPLPINPAAVEHRRHIAGCLASWCKLVADERGIQPPEGPQVYRTAPWLTVHIDWCAGNRWVDEMLTELRAAAGRARAITYPSGSKRIKIGPCRSVTDDKPCDGLLFATVRAEDDMRPSLIYCDTCEFEKAPEEWLRFGREYDREMSA